MDKRNRICITGHLNPDTDSICAAIAYASLKSRLGTEEYVPCMTDDMSPETEWVLNKFGLDAPSLLSDVHPRISDAELQHINGISPDATVKEAWKLMHSQDVSILPVLTAGNKLAGLLSLKDLAVAYMDSLDTHALAHSATTYEKIASTLSGKVLVKGNDAVSRNGYIMIGAGDDEAIGSSVRPGDVVLLSNRESSQLTAIAHGAKGLVICLGAVPGEKVIKAAEDHGCAIVTTPFDTYKASYFINQSIPVSHYMKTGKLETFQLDQTIEDALQETSSSRNVYFPVLDGSGSYLGMVTRRNMLGYRKQKLILVDHNEETQCVPGWETAEILEIIDHHRVGGLRTIEPIVFMNQPVGSTCTIIFGLYKDRGLLPPPAVAGAMCCAIISDTLKFRSPTATKADVEAANELAKLAGESIDDLAAGMFEAGESLEGKTAFELLHQDYKEFSAFDMTFSASQLSFFSPDALSSAASLIMPELKEEIKASKMDCCFVMLTDIGTQSSLVLSAGNRASVLLKAAFPGLTEDPMQRGVILNGVVSRKKQLIPAFLEALSRLENERRA